MYLIQILLPLPSTGSTASMLTALHRTLVERFGGLTAYAMPPRRIYDATDLMVAMPVEVGQRCTASLPYPDASGETEYHVEIASL